MAKSKPMPGTIGLKLLGFARTRIQRYVSPAANLSPTNSALPASWQQATEEPLVWQQDTPDSEPLTPIMEQPEAESENAPPQENRIAPQLLRLLDMHEARQSEDSPSESNDTPATVRRATPQSAPAPVMRKAAPKGRPGATEQRRTPPASPRTIARQEDTDDGPRIEVPSLDDASYTANTYSENVIPRPPSGEVHEIIQPKRPRPTLRPAADVSSPSQPQPTPSVQRKPAAEPIQHDAPQDSFDVGIDEPDAFSPAVETYFETDIPEPILSEPTYSAPEIHRAVQDNAPAQNPTSQPSVEPQQPLNPYFAVAGQGTEDEIYGDTEPIIYSPEPIQRKPAESSPTPTSNATPSPTRPTPRLDAIQRSVESVEKNIQEVQRNLDNIQRFVDGGKPESRKSRSDPSESVEPTATLTRVQRQAGNPGYTQLDAPQQDLVYGFEDEMPDVTTPYTPVQVDHQTPSAQVNRSAAEPDVPVVHTDAPYENTRFDNFAETPGIAEDPYQNYMDYSAAPDTGYQAPSETWSDSVQDEPDYFEPPAAAHNETPQTPTPRQASRQIVQAKRVPVNRPIQRVEDYSEEYQAETQEPAEYNDYSTYSSVPENDSPEADLLRLLNLPTDTPVAGLKPPTTPASPNSNIISRKPMLPSANGNSWQGEVDISEPYNEAESDEDDDYTPLPNQIQPVSLDQILNPSPRPQGETPVQRMSETDASDDESAQVQPISLDQALLSNPPSLPIQRSESPASPSPSVASPSSTNSNPSEQNEQNKNPNVDKLAREVYRLLREKLRIEQERRSDKS